MISNPPIIFLIFSSTFHIKNIFENFNQYFIKQILNNTFLYQNLKIDTIFDIYVMFFSTLISKDIKIFCIFETKI